MKKVLSTIAAITGWLSAIIGVAIPAVTVKDVKEKCIWILAIVLGEMIIVLIAVIVAFREQKKEYEKTTSETIKELENRVTIPQFGNCHIDAYDKLDDTLSVQNLPIIDFNEAVTICWKRSGVVKRVGYGYVINKDNEKSTIQILSIFKKYEPDVRTILENGKCVDFIDVFLAPLIYEKEIKEVVNLIESYNGDGGQNNAESKVE